MTLYILLLVEENLTLFYIKSDTKSQKLAQAPDSALCVQSAMCALFQEEPRHHSCIWMLNQGTS